IYIRSAQQPIAFDLRPGGANSAQVKVDDGPWVDLGAGIPYIWWTNPPTTPGQYTVTLKYVGPQAANGATRTYTLNVVPPATARFGDGAGNTMVFWQGGTTMNDRPF